MFRRFMTWNRDNHANFAAEVEKQLATKVDADFVAKAIAGIPTGGGDKEPCDTSDKVSRSGDTMTGDLTIGNSSTSTHLRFVRMVGATPIGGHITDNGQGLTFGSSTGGLRSNLYAMSNGSTLGFYPLSNNHFPLGNTNNRWSQVFATRLNNGAEIIIPNKAGTLALLSDIPTGNFDTSDKVSKTGDTMTGELQIGLPTGSGATTFPITLRGKFSDTSVDYAWGLGLSTLSPIFYIRNGTQLVVGISPTLGIFPANTNNTLTLGYNGRPWANAFVRRLNNGADIEIPTKAGTLALLSDIPAAGADGGGMQLVSSASGLEGENYDRGSYEEYSNGKIDQRCRINFGSVSSSQKTIKITLPKEMPNDEYIAVAQLKTSTLSSHTAGVYILEQTPTTITLNVNPLKNNNTVVGIFVNLIIQGEVKPTNN